jgi:type I restriction enzyme S subunit
MSWVHTTLGEFFKKTNGIIQTGPFGSSLHQKDYKSEGTPVIMPKDIINDKVNTANIARIGQDDWIRLQKYAVKSGDIIYPRRGEISKRALITPDYQDMLCGTGCILIRNNSSNIDSLFLNYFLAYKPTVDWLENNAVGSTMKNLSGSILSKLPLIIPPIQTQKRIASILSAYDDLIENNLKRIKLLEETAQNIYKEWFVNFRFPNYENTPFNEETGLPEGWEKDIIGNQLLTIKRNGKLKTDHYEKEGRFPIIDQGNGYIAGYTNNEEIVQNQQLPIVIFGDHTRRVKFVNFPFVSGADGTQLMYPKNEKMLPAYFYLSIKSIDLSNYAYARHFKFMKEQSILIPDIKTLNDFNSKVYPLLEQLIKLFSYNQKLKEARDILLPRLMNRTIEV